MAKKENQRVALTKRLLRQALLQLMEKKSLQSISVSELCACAGVNRTTFYNHYTAPAQLLREIGSNMAAEIQALLQKKCGATVTLREEAEIVCAYLQKNKRTAKILFQNNTPESEFAEWLIQGQEQWAEVSGALTAKYGEDGKDLLLTFWIHGAYCMITKWLLGGSKRTPKEMGEMIGSFRVDGLTI